MGSDYDSVIQGRGYRTPELYTLDSLRTGNRSFLDPSFCHSASISFAPHITPPLLTANKPAASDLVLAGWIDALIAVRAVEWRIVPAREW